MKTKTHKVDPKRVALFLGMTEALRSGPISQSGQWLISPSPFKWAECKDQIQALKDAGFKSAWARGNRIGVNVKDVAVLAA
jgi:hypothetical protein